MYEAILSWLHSLAWLAFLVYWIVSALGTKRVARAEPLWLRLGAYWLPLALAMVLLGPGEWFSGSPLQERFIPESVGARTLGLLLTIAGIALACRARQLLGRNWSSEVQIKQDHELIQAGPYRYVRHPIYSGLLLAILGTAIKVGDWRGLLALAIVTASFWYKLRHEERWLREQFGEPYAAYQRRTSALIPGLL